MRATKCSKCGHAMNLEAPLTRAAEVRGEQFEVQVSAQQCPNCGRVVLAGKTRRAYHRAASDAYRQRHELLTAQEIDRLRRNLGMTWKQFAEFACVGSATLKRWMGGEIQSTSLDALVRLKADWMFAQQATDDLLARLTDNAAAYVETVEVSAPVVRRRRPRIEQDWAETAHSQYALAA